MLTKTANLVAHLEKIALVSFYAAPDHARITPFVIPGGMELVEVITGGKVYFPNADGVRSIYGKGSIFWHQAGEHTVYDTTPDAPYRCMVFRFAVSERLRPVPRVGFWRQPGRLDDFCAEAMELYSEGANPELTGAYLYGTLLRQFCAPGKSRAELPEALNRILSYIDSTHGCDASTARLCEAGFIGQAQLFRLFRSYLGTTPRDYARGKRMSYARMLLLSNKLSIKETAEECGYTHLEVFYRNFWKANRMTPGEYRTRQAPYQSTDF